MSLVYQASLWCSLFPYPVARTKDCKVTMGLFFQEAQNNARPKVKVGLYGTHITINRIISLILKTDRQYWKTRRKTFKRVLRWSGWACMAGVSQRESQEWEHRLAFYKIQGTDYLMEKVCLVLEHQHPDLSIPAGLSSVKCLVVEDNIMADNDDSDMCSWRTTWEKSFRKSEGHTGIDSDHIIIFCLQNYPGPSRRQWLLLPTN